MALWEAKGSRCCCTTWTSTATWWRRPSGRTGCWGSSPTPSPSCTTSSSCLRKRARPEQTASCGQAFGVRSYTHSDLLMTKLKILQVGISRRQTSFLVLLLHQSGEEGKIQHEELLHSTISILKSVELPLCLASLL